MSLSGAHYTHLFLAASLVPESGLLDVAKEDEQADRQMDIHGWRPLATSVFRLHSSFIFTWEIKILIALATDLLRCRLNNTQLTIEIHPDL